MESPSRRPSRRRRTPRFAAAVALAATTLAGCNHLNGWLHDPKPVPCALRPDATKEEIIRHLNDNTTKLIAWRSTEVKIKTTTPQGIPIKLSADIAVESPRNFRLVAKSIAGYEADFGSNPERFWFWMRRGKPKHLFTVRHDEFDSIRGRFPIPFRPDWLMEAFGVVPLDPAQYEMQPRVADSDLVSLVSHQTTPDGRQVRRVVLVDACAGHIVKQTLYDAAGRTIASAEFHDYRFDAASGVHLAHQIDFDWPRTNTAMTLHIGRVHVNPGDMRPEMWMKPAYEGFPEIDLARHFGRMPSRKPVGRTPDSPHRVVPGTVPTPDQVGRVRIGPAGSENERERKSAERPLFADEHPDDSTPEFRREFVPPIQREERHPEPARSPSSRTGEAPPFPDQTAFGRR